MTEYQQIRNEAFAILEATAEALCHDLRHALTKVSETTKTYIFKDRRKSSDSITTKVLRKRAAGRVLKERYADSKDAEAGDQLLEADRLINYGPENVTDVHGFRYVTLYQSDIPVVVGALLRALEEFNSRLQSHEEPLQPYEFVVYTNRPTTDPISIVDETVETVKASGFAKLIQDGNIRPPESRKSAYSSVHFVFTRSVFRGKPDQADQERTAWFEIQIRDIFEEGWGEIQHHLLYSEKDKSIGFPLIKGDALRRQWELQLNALKTFVDGCSQHASIIKGMLEEISNAPTPTSLTQSITQLDKDRDQVQRALRSQNAHKSATDAVADGYGRLLNDSAIDSENKRFENFQGAAAAFDRALKLLPPNTLEAIVKLPGNKPIKYHLQMEAAAARALCLPMLRDVEKHAKVRQEAIDIYTDVLSRNWGDPIAEIRLGKILEQGMTDESLKSAIEHYDRALENLDSDLATGPEHWVAISTRIDRGVAFWKMAGLCQENASRALLLRRAFHATLDAYQTWRQQTNRFIEQNRISGHKASSNAVYFVAKLKEAGANLSEQDVEITRNLLVEMADSNAPRYSDYYKTVDNMMHGYWAIGEDAISYKLANENFTFLRSEAEAKAGRPLDQNEIQTYLSGAALTCFLDALKIIQSH